jgi:predicted amidohydrolase
MNIALATLRVAPTVRECLEKIEHHIADAAAKGAEIVCFPEAYLPGLRGLDFDVPQFDPAHQEQAVVRVAACAASHRIATILSMERNTSAGRQIVAIVIDARGHILGVQTKNQLDPTEDAHYVPGSTRQIFEINGVKFGVAICHEGFRYPETVRWAAVRGAKIVFHPHCTGSDKTGPTLTKFAAADAPYYEQAMLMRSRENTIYFASVNYAFRYQESATCIITPTGECLAYLPYGQEGVLVQPIDVETATGILAKRFAPERY